VSGPVVSIAHIQREAATAAQTYTCINAACPYPFHSDAAHVFKEAFFAERKVIEAARQARGTKPATPQTQLPCTCLTGQHGPDYCERHAA